MRAIAEAGADLIELGVPFSDPLADGPTIQRSTQVALRQGMTVRRCLEAVAALRRDGVHQPLLLMGYVNPILAYGLPRFVADAVAAGADGLDRAGPAPRGGGRARGCLPQPRLRAGLPVGAHRQRRTHAARWRAARPAFSTWYR